MENVISSVFSGKKLRSLVETASLIAYVAHQGQVRKDDSSPYFIHPCQVGLKLTALGFDERVVAAGFVHDVLEDTTFPQSELERLLGTEVLEIVLAVSEDKTLSWEERKKQYINLYLSYVSGRNMPIYLHSVRKVRKRRIKRAQHVLLIILKR
jgi:(p)ppGpp synthase/HD superfamily hydrolase